VFYLAIYDGLFLAQEAESSDPAGSAFGTLFFFALIIGGGYLLFIRPQRRRMKAMEDLRSSIDVGSEVRTVGGIYGTILELDDEVVVLDTGGGGRLRVARRAVAENLSGTEPSYDEDDEE
jgi:preprotein translocase subunit YajC